MPPSQSSSQIFFYQGGLAKHLQAGKHTWLHSLTNQEWDKSSRRPEPSNPPCRTFTSPEEGTAAKTLGLSFMRMNPPGGERLNGESN